MFIIKYRKIFFTVSGLIVTLAIVAVIAFGLNLGIQFTGGDIAEIKYDTRPAKSIIEAQLKPLQLGTYSLRRAGKDKYILRTKSLNKENRGAVLTTLKKEGGIVERFNSVGPTIGIELRNKAIVAMFAVMFAIILFVTFVFRRVSKPVSSWKYGVIAVIALIHDVIVPTGLFALLGFLFGAKIDVLFVMALLAIIGYSVNDTIVVFDRVRENLRKNEDTNRKEDFELTVGKSLNQTYVRSINTSFTTLIVLLALFFIGAPITQDFALVLIVGIIAGTYSSLCLATPLLVTLQKLGDRK